MKRWGITLVGSGLLAVGIVLIPYPGPGWLIVFAGLAVLSKEHEWAHRLLHRGRQRLDSWNRWIARQHIIVRSLTLIATTIITVMTLWLINAYGLIDSWLRLGLPWLHSPFLW